MQELTVLLFLLSVGLTLIIHLVPSKNRNGWELGTMGLVLGIAALCAVLTDGTLGETDMMLLFIPLVLVLGFDSLKMLGGLKR